MNTSTVADIAVIDQCLPPRVFSDIARILGGDMFPWYFNAQRLDVDQAVMSDFQFTHAFYSDGAWRSEWTHVAKPIVTALPHRGELVRMKANLNVWNPTRALNGFHFDNEDPAIMAALLYVNDSDGGTVFEDGTRIECQANRLVVFPANLSHSGVSATNVKSRIVVNINYRTER